MLATTFASACAMLCTALGGGVTSPGVVAVGPDSAFVRADLNLDGVVDFEDAYLSCEEKQPGTGNALRAILELRPSGLSIGSPAADLNGDGVLDFQDWLMFLNCFSTCAPCADFNGDGTCDFLDWLAFLNA